MFAIDRCINFYLAFKFGGEVFGLPDVGGYIQIARVKFDAVGIFPMHVGKAQNGVARKSKLLAAVIGDVVTSCATFIYPVIDRILVTRRADEPKNPKCSDKTR